MALMQLVENWPMESYPWRPDWKGQKKGLIYTTHWKFEFRKKDGTMDFKMWEGVQEEVDESGKKVEVPVKVPYQAKVATVYRTAKPFVEPSDEGDREWMGFMSVIPPEDIRRAENEIGGKPTGVLAGLWHKWDGNTWVELDMEKVRVPLYWLDVTDLYYKVMREDAYFNKFDPYKGQERPYTKIQELELKLRESGDLLLSKQIENQKAKIAELEAELAKKAVK
jgi:hypothetical protein